LARRRRLKILLGEFGDDTMALGTLARACSGRPRRTRNAAWIALMNRDATTPEKEAPHAIDHHRYGRR
jgi:hypothetical protein